MRPFALASIFGCLWVLASGSAAAQEATPEPPAEAPSALPQAPYVAQPRTHYYILEREPRDRPRRARSWILPTVGFAMFGASYLGVASLGMLALKDCGSKCGRAGRLLIPVAGPLTVMPNEESAHGTDDIVQAMLIADSVVQLAGIVLAVIGLVHAANRDDEPPRELTGLQCQWAPTPGGGYAGVRLNF